MRVIIIHGTEGNPNVHWLPWLADRVTQAGHQAVVPHLPTPEGQNLRNWRDSFDRAVGPLTSDDIIVGHSVGATFALRLLETASVTIKATFLVAGFAHQLDIPSLKPLVSTFVEHSFDWPIIKERAGNAYVYHSENDPYVPVSMATEIANNLQANLHVIPNGGHLNTDSGFTEFDRLWQDISLDARLASL